ncbi:MAG: hypothetical protein Q9174_002388 [Haloplaca sp. 1 TL-2023]
MSGAAEGSSQTTKLQNSSTTPSTTMKDEQKPAAALEEDDEFEDFPVEGEFADWPAEDQEVPPGQEGTTHLWEESWDDDDTSEDFSKQLK